MKKKPGAEAHADPAMAEVEEAGRLPRRAGDDREPRTEPGQEKPKFAKLKIALELKDAKVEAEVKPLLPRIEDTFQVYMRELRASDLDGSAGIYRLREELLRRVNVAIYPAKVDAVLFKEVVVQ